MPFEQALAESDVLTLHCPLNAGTRHMIGAPEFALMGRKPLLINTARGGLVDEAAVGPALEAGQISGAAFDVVSAEPPSADHLRAEEKGTSSTTLRLLPCRQAMIASVVLLVLAALAAKSAREPSNAAFSTATGCRS